MGCLGLGLVYCANVGGYDSQRLAGAEGESEHYDVLLSMNCKQGETPQEKARFLKVMRPTFEGMEDYNWFLWLDGSMEITAPIMPLVEKLLASEHDFAAFKHPEWQCAYKEIDACIERKKDTPKNLGLMRKSLEDSKFPKNFGQAATGVLWRRNISRVRDHARMWWEYLEGFTMRDQCSFMPVLWEIDAYVEWIPGSHLKNKWFRYHQGHK